MRSIGCKAFGSILLVLAAGCARHEPPALDPAADRRGAVEVENLPAMEEPDPATEKSRRRPEPQSAPATLSQDPPLYPPSAVALEIACTARVLYHILTDGSAAMVRLDWDVAPPDAKRAAFESAIREAVAAWSFVPAKRYVLRTRSDGTEGIVEQPIPKARRAILRFRVVEGRGLVEGP